MTKKMSYRWMLRERMAERGWWKTTDLTPLLAERGIHLYAAQTYRHVANTPEPHLEVGIETCHGLDFLQGLPSRVHGGDRGQYDDEQRVGVKLSPGNHEVIAQSEHHRGKQHTPDCGQQHNRRIRQSFFHA